MSKESRNQFLYTLCLAVAAIILITIISGIKGGRELPREPGIYYALEKVDEANIWVKVRMTEDTILSVDILDNEISGDDRFLAMDAMSQKIEAYNSPYVSGVSGDGRFADAVRNGVLSCIYQACGKEALVEYAPPPDNTDPLPLDYEYAPGQYYAISDIDNGEGFTGGIEVLVDFNEFEIENITMFDNGDDKFSLVDAVLPDEIIKWQTYELDAVSGATDTSNGLKAAVKNCVEQARIQ